MKKSISVLLFSILGVFQISQATIINVPGDRPTIQTGVNSAQAGDTVLVFPGIYMENVVIRDRALVLASHFILNHDDITIDSTIIDGDMDSSVITIRNTPNPGATVEGFTIRNGQTNGAGGGILITGSGTQATIRNNGILDNSSVYMGGGMACNDGATATVCYNFIANNTSIYDNGGGIAAYRCTLNAYNNVIKCNYAKL